MLLIACPQSIRVLPSVFGRWWGSSAIILNTPARALVSGKTRIFGLVVSEITNPFFPEIVQSFENIAVEHNYEILLSSTVHDPKRMELSVRRMIERRVEGVAVLTFGMEDSLLEHLRFRSVPLVFVDVGPRVPRVSNIRINYQHGIRQAVQHLAALRHEIEGNHTMEGGMTALARLATLQSRPTAVMCSNDVTAVRPPSPLRILVSSPAASARERWSKWYRLGMGKAPSGCTVQKVRLC